MTGNEIRNRLRSGDRVYGTHVVSFGNAVAADLTSKLEMDFAFICTEHMPVDRKELSTMCHFYASKGISPIVRIPYPAAHWATMYIDAGAHGIVAPYVETIDQVQSLVGAVRYRPLKGKFLRDILDSKRMPNEKMMEYLERNNREKYLIIGIESVEAINNLEALISDDGVDGVFLGPHDITCSMEIPEEYDNPMFVNTIKDVIRRCRRLGKGVGLHGDLSNYLDTEMNFMINKADVIKMREKLSHEFQQLRKYYGDVYDSNTQVDAARQCIE